MPRGTSRLIASSAAVAAASNARAPDRWLHRSWPSRFSIGPGCRSCMSGQHAATGDVRPEPNGGRIVPSFLIEDAAHAEVVAAVLESPLPHIGKIYELTGPRPQDMASMAAEYAAALGRPVTYVDVPFDDWRDQELRSRGLPDHVFDHFVTMARLHANDRYNRMTHDIEVITGRPASTVRASGGSEAGAAAQRAPLGSGSGRSLFLG